MQGTGRRRLRRGRTRDPWPCCDKDVDQERGRPKDTICSDCGELIRIGRNTRERHAQAGEQTYYWAQEPHWWPQYYGQYEFTKHDLKRKLADAMFELVNLITTPVETRHWRKDGDRPVIEAKGRPQDYEYGGTVLVSADPATRDAVNELDARIRECLKSAYDAGKAEGQRSLLQLASGRCRWPTSSAGPSGRSGSPAAVPVTARSGRVRTIQAGLPGGPAELRQRGAVATLALRAPDETFTERVEALIATGTPVSCIDAATARRLRLPADGAGAATASAWIEMCGLGWPRRVHAFREVPRAERYAVVIGMDLIRHVELEYHGATGSVTLSREGPAAEGDGTEADDLGAIDWSECPHVRRRLDRMSGAWCFGDTRMPVSALFHNLASGLSVREFLDAFDTSLEAEPLEVLRFVADRLDATWTNRARPVGRPER